MDAENGESGGGKDTPAPARTPGDRRARIAGVVAALAIAVLAGVIGGTVAIRTGLVPDAGAGPSTPVDGSATPTPPAGRPLAEAQLPKEPDLEWQQPGDWKITNTFPGSGSTAASECFRGKPESLGAERTFHRTYTYQEKNQGSATALEFGTEEAARKAFRTFTAWADGCEETLLQKGFRKVGGRDWKTVRTARGEAKFRVINTDGAEDADAGSWRFQEYGLIITGRRVEVLIFKVEDEDHDWAGGPNDGGQLLDPMIRSLPKVATRLAGGTGPTGTPDPTPGPASPSPRKNPNPNRLRVGEAAKLDYFTITLQETTYSRRGFAARIRTCVTDVPPGGYEPDAIPVGWYPWRAITSDRAYPAGTEDPDDPALEPPYPDGAKLAVGDCLTGWLPFDEIDKSRRVTQLTYRNDYDGGEARWLLG